MSGNELVVKKMKMLLDLCEKTEPDLEEFKRMRPDGSAVVDELFTYDLIDAKTYYNAAKKEEYDSYTLPEIMRSANKIWKFRKHIEKDGWDSFGNIEYECAELLKQNQKINAIKCYRKHMTEVLRKEVGLKESKEWVDKLQVRLGLDN